MPALLEPAVSVRYFRGEDGHLRMVLVSADPLIAGRWILREWVETLGGGSASWVVTHTSDPERAQTMADGVCKGLLGSGYTEQTAESELRELQRTLHNARLRVRWLGNP